MGSRQSYQVDGTRWMKHSQVTKNYRYNNFISWYLRHTHTGSTSGNSPKYIWHQIENWSQHTWDLRAAKNKFIKEKKYIKWVFVKIKLHLNEHGWHECNNF